MRESQRLAYLQAIGVTGWVPRVGLALAAPRLPSEPEPLLEESALTPVDVKAAPGTQVQSVQTEPAVSTVKPESSPSARLVAQQHAQVTNQAASKQPVDQTLPPAAKVVAAAMPEQKGRSIAPFYLQLWMAGPCALLIEISDPGLEKSTPEHNLLCDILRAAVLPAAPRLQADFRWPLSRNPQVARSAEAASEALQVFMQARLELQPVKSIGCFGAMAALLATGDPEDAEALKGREQALDELGSGWFAPGIEVMMHQPEEKARLWQLLKRVMPRWVEAQ